MRFQNGSNKVVIELRVVQFLSEIILVISNQTRPARSFDFEITRMISDQIALHSVQLPLLIGRHSVLLSIMIKIKISKKNKNSQVMKKGQIWAKILTKEA